MKTYKLWLCGVTEAPCFNYKADMSLGYIEKCIFFEFKQNQLLFQLEFLMRIEFYASLMTSPW